MYLYNTYIIASCSRRVVNTELQNQTAQPSTVKSVQKFNQPPRVLIDQADFHTHVFSPIVDSEHIGQVLMIYLYSLAKHKISAQDDLSKMIIMNLVKQSKLDTLRNLIKFSLINESTPLACFLLSLKCVHHSITQMVLDMLHKLKADTVSVQ